MNQIAILLLRVLIALIFGIALLGQTVIAPFLANEFTAIDPRATALATPSTIGAIAVIACVQVALIALWVLLSKVGSGAIFSQTSFRWVDTIIGSAAMATLLTLGLILLVTAHEQIGPPPLLLMMLCTAVAGTTFVLLMLVMRGLLRQASALQSELAEVV